MRVKKIIVVGQGAIGLALRDELARRYPQASLYIITRRQHSSLARQIDLPVADYDEIHLAKAASQVGAGVDAVIVTTGLLHDEGIMPEKTWRELSPEHMLRLYTANAVVPALLIKHFMGLLRSGPTIFAALSARVASMSDNRLGGWYAYRASKAALNMLIKNAAIEMARKNKEAVVVGLHPGTVESPLSQPFWANVPKSKRFSASFSARCLLDVLLGLTAKDSGRCFAWDGQEILP